MITPQDLSKLVSKLSDTQMLVNDLASALKECADGYVEEK